MRMFNIPLPACISHHDSTFDPDDRWSNQYREREKNNLYKWVGVQSGGDLITVYEKEGEDGVNRFAQEKLESMMYNEGRATYVIKFQEYVRWKKSMNVAFGITEEEEIDESRSNFKEHESQWKLNKRGVEGETLIHVLLNREEPVCSEIARILINRYPGLSKDIYLGDEMFGQSCLHLAIVHDDYETVQLLLEKGASVNARASGDFFMLENPGRNKRNLTYQGYAYYGEFPLAFAACFENKDIYDILILHGGDPDSPDRFGNSCLHMCVINSNSSMYSYAVRHWKKPARTDLPNYAGYTPLTLAAKLGRKQIFDEMLELMKVEFWRFSDMTCSAYPLDALDTIRPDGSTNYDSALITIINGNTPEHLDIIGSEVIQRLLADKWKAFASRKLWERLGLLIFHLICICFAVYLRPTSLDELYMIQPTWKDWARFVFEISAIIASCWFVFVQQFGEFRTQGFGSYVQNLRTTPAKVVYFAANMFLLACVPFRVMQYCEVEEGLLVFALPGSWIFLLFFARSLQLTGPFVQMIYNMIAGDMIRFGIISSIFLVSFSQVFYFVGKDMMAKQQLPVDNPNRCGIQGYDINTFSSYLETFVSLFRASMGGYDYDELECANYEPLTKTLFVLYMFIMPIMMINILIAMMGNTYTTIITQAEKAWRKQYAQIVMALERSVDRRKLAACQLEYSIKLNEPGKNIRGLMVIKQAAKTKALQRKQALHNWKLIGRKIILVWKELGKNLDAAKFLVHNHDRIIADDTVVLAGGVGPGGIGGTRNVGGITLSTQVLSMAATDDRRASDGGSSTPRLQRRPSLEPATFDSFSSTLLSASNSLPHNMITMSRQQQRLKTSQQLLFTTAGLGLRQIPLHQAAADIERHLLRSRASDDTPGRPGPSSGEGSNEEKLADFQDSSNRQETPIDQVLSSKKQMARNPARQIQPEIENRSHIFGGEVFPAVAVPNMPGDNAQPMHLVPPPATPINYTSTYGSHPLQQQHLSHTAPSSSDQRMRHPQPKELIRMDVRPITSPKSSESDSDGIHIRPID